MSGFDKIKSATRDYYEAALEIHGEGAQAVNWRNAESQRLRFDVLCQIGDLDGKKIHDVGCGLAHLYDYVKEAGINTDYIGSDISTKMIEASRQRLGGRADLRVADITEDNPPDWMRADFVVSSGIFTVRGNIPDREWREFVLSFIVKMFDLAKTGIGFNMMTSHVDYQDDHLCYFDPGEVLEFCVGKLSRKVIVRHDYPLWEFTVFVYR